MDIRDGDTLVDVYAKTEFVVTDARLPQDGVRVLPAAGDVERVFYRADIAQKVSAGAYVHRPKGAPRFPPALQDDQALERATARALQVLGHIQEYSQRHDVSFSAAYQRVRENYERDQNTERFPSQATLYRYRNSRHAGLPLLVGDKNKGNRKARYGADVCALIERLARQHYLVPQSRVNILALTEIVNRQAMDAGLSRSGSRISRKFIHRIVVERLSADPQYERLDPKLRAAAKSIASHQIRTFNVLERVEQDALHLPFVVQTPAGPSRNVWLVHAICCATSMPVGWSIVVGAPNASDGLRCTESVLFSKRQKFEALGVPVGVDVFGLPATLVFDNGPEAKNDRMMALTRLGVSVQYCKSRHPQHKPFIERLNRSLKDALQILPGCTRFDGVDGKRDPESLGDPLMGIDELERWIVRWYYEQWANNGLTRLVHTSQFADANLGGTPRQRFMRLTEQGYAMPLPPNRCDWLMTTYAREERVLSRKTGVTVEGFHFRGANLAPLVGRLGEARVCVLYDPEDFRLVYVLDDEQLVALHNTAVDETTPAYSFSVAKERESLIVRAANAEGAEQRAAFERDLHERALQEPVKSRRSRRSAKDASRQTTAGVKHDAAVARAVANPLPPLSSAETSGGDICLGAVEGLMVVHRKTGVSL